MIYQLDYWEIITTEINCIKEIEIWFIVCHFDVITVNDRWIEERLVAFYVEH